MAIFPNDGTQMLMGGKKLWHLTYDYSDCLPTTLEITPFGVPDEFISAIQISPSGENIYIGFMNGDLFKGSEGPFSGWIWSNITPETHSNPITSIAIHPTNESKLAVSYGGYIDDNVVISNDAGSNWQVRVDGLNSVHINSLCWHPIESGWIYAGTDFGVMASEDNGQNWNVSPILHNTSDGPLMTEVRKVEFASQTITGAHLLFATTYGRGIWRTETSVMSDIYLDENGTNTFSNGSYSAPFKSIESANEVITNGNTVHIDGGTYTTSGSTILDKRIGEIKKTGTGSVVIGEN